jgi:hypothetical protein
MRQMSEVHTSLKRNRYFARFSPVVIEFDDQHRLISQNEALMNYEEEDVDLVAQENEDLQRELRILGRDPAVPGDLLRDEMNLRLKKALRFAEEEKEARLLGKEPPPRFLDPLSPDWIPDVDDKVHRNARQPHGQTPCTENSNRPTTRTVEVDRKEGKCFVES